MYTKDTKIKGVNVSITYSDDLRKLALKKVADSKKQKKDDKVKAAAKAVGVCEKTIYTWIAIQKATGSVSPKTGYQKGHSHKIIDLETFKKFIDENAGLSFNDLALKYGNVSPATIGRAIKKLGYTYKKKVMFMPKVAKKQDDSMK
jgi:transposase